MTRPDDRHEWEERYREREQAPLRPPSAFLARVLPGLPRGLALDVACGDGRNAIHLARNGYRVEAFDRARTALQRARRLASAEALSLGLVCADLETYPLPRSRYVLVVNVRYLDRRRLSDLAAALQPGGHLIFETFTTRQAQLGRPRNPEHLLRPGELRHCFATLQVLQYEEGLVESELGPAWLARLLARRPVVD